MFLKMEIAVLVGLDRPGQEENFEPALEELALLAETAGAEAVYTMVQKKEAPDPALYIGKGKAKELAELVKDLAADLVIFLEELSPSQMRNLERLLEIKIVDRTSLILDIFARRARSREGKLQVELAQLNYLLPRLTGMGSQLSRLGGGIGTRGPGETQLEIDRRVIRKRIRDLQHQIKNLRRHRRLHRSRRERNSIPVISLVGYTNAGKSTLLNALTGADIYTEDKLFATLDPSVRRAVLSGGRSVLFADTVGFIHHLPETLETAFRATLEEISASDLILHVVDLSHPSLHEHIAVVRKHLEPIVPAYSEREMMVFNKSDLAVYGDYSRGTLERDYPGALFVSALKYQGLQKLSEALIGKLESGFRKVIAYLPYSESSLLEKIKRSGSILSMKYHGDYLTVTARVDEVMAGRLLAYESPPVKSNSRRD